MFTVYNILTVMISRWLTVQHMAHTNHSCSSSSSPAVQQCMNTSLQQHDKYTHALGTHSSFTNLIRIAEDLIVDYDYVD